jgi:hypothetical protein
MARRRKRSGAARTTRCKYVATRGTKRAAGKLAGELKRDGFRTLVTKAYGAARVGWGVFSCGRRKGRR